MKIAIRNFKIQLSHTDITPTSTTTSTSASLPDAVFATFTVVVFVLPVIVWMILLSAEAPCAPTDTVDVLLLPSCLRVNVCVAPTTDAEIVLVLPI